MIRITGSPVDRHKIYAATRLPYQRGYTEAQERDHACHVRDNRISGTEKGEIASGRSADGDIM
jgi:hypothetical protein